MLGLYKAVKFLGGKKILHEIDIQVDSPKIYGLIGPNGAGKTTILRLMTGLLQPDNGRVIRDNAHDISYMPEETGLYMDMSVKSLLIYFGHLQNISKEKTLNIINPLLTLFSLEANINTKIRTLSKGNQRKIQFISILLNDPKILILDEPFSSLDPISSDILEKILIRLKDEGKIILLSTHRMEHAELLCDHIFMIQNGKKIMDNTLESIQVAYLQNTYEIHVRHELGLEDIPYTKEYNGIYYKYKVDLKTFTVPYLLDLITRQNNDIFLFRQIRPSLKEIFFKLLNT